MGLWAKMANRAYNLDLRVWLDAYTSSPAVPWKALARKKEDLLELEGNGLRKLKDVT
jgi:hypothetical protein